MWGFLYSKNFGPLADDLRCVRRRRRRTSSATSLIFYGLLNVVTWQWAGYYMIILYAALQGIDPTLYEAARIDGASRLADRPADQDPLLAPRPGADPGLRASIGTLQFFNEPKILQQPRRRRHRPTTSRRTCTPTSRRSRWRTTTTARRSRSRSGAVVFVCVYIFLFATGKRGSFLVMSAAATSTRHARVPPGPRATCRCSILLGFAGDLLPDPLLVGDREQLEGLGRALRRRQRPVVRRRHQLRPEPQASCSPTAAASTRAGCCNSALYAFVGGVGATVLAVLAGYGFAKYRFAGRAVSRSPSCSAP